MAINSQPLVALGIRTDYPPPDILGNQVKLSALRGQQQAQQIQAQQQPLVTQGLQQENQQRALELQSQQAQMKAATDPSIGWDKPGAYDRYLEAARQNGALPGDLFKLQSGIVDMKQKIATTDKDTLANQITQNDTRRGKLLSIIQQKDPAVKQQSWQQEIQAEEQSGGVPQGQFPMQYPGDQTATMLANHLAQGSVLAKEAIDEQNAAGRNKPTLETLARDVNDPDPKVSSTAKAAMATMSDYQAAIAAKTAGARVGAENSPEAIAGAVNKARAVATDPQIIAAKAQEQATAASMVEQAKQRLNPSALASVLPQLVAPATAAFDKSGQEYAKSVQAASDLGELIGEAKGGNKAAVRIVPLQGALEINTAQGVHRINRTDIDQVAGAGSWFDKVNGELGGALTGKNIPDNVLHDIQKMQDVITKNARTLHQNSVQTINKTYGSKFEPMNFNGGQQQSGASTSAPKIGDVKTFPNGNKGKWDGKGYVAI